MRLVPDWRDAGRWWSVRIMAILTVLPAVWMSMPPEAKVWLPPEWQPWLLSVLALGGIVGRLKDQDPPEN